MTSPGEARVLMLFTHLRGQLQRLEIEGLSRCRRMIDGPQQIHLKIDGRDYLSFCSNDYLGLASHPLLIAAAREGAELYGVGAGSSHLVSGHTAAHQRVEEKLADFLGLPRALLFSTGYMANLGVVTALAERGAALFADKLNHASLNDAAILSRAKLRRYPHLDKQALEKLLAACVGKTRLVLSDSVFSMDGDIAPVPELLALCERYDAWLLLDDAHGFGVLGREGRGVLSHFNVNSPRIIYMGTLGKAAGVFGAFVAGEDEIIQTLIQRARTYIYTTATPPLLAHTLLKSLDLIRTESARRTQLATLVALLKNRVRPKHWQLVPSQTPIQPLIIGESREAAKVSAGLSDAGILVPAIRPPSVPKGSARLRISLSAAHSTDDVEKLVSTLHKLEKEIEPQRR